MKQIEKCDYYKQMFEQQGNMTLANRFAGYSVDSSKSLELLRTSLQNNEDTPEYRFESVTFACSPIDLEVREKELQLEVKVKNLAIPSDAIAYIIAEFEFPCSKDETVSETLGRKIRYVKIEPSRFCFCSGEPSQLDVVYCTTVKPFTESESEETYFERPLAFFVDKGRSRTLKRKFKPVKLTFFHKTRFYRQDTKLGTIQVRIDSINDEICSIHKLPLMNGRKKTDAEAEVKVKVREPLVDKSARDIEEKLLYLGAAEM